MKRLQTRSLRKRWQEPHPEAELAALAALRESCRAEEVRFGIGLSPFELHLHPDRGWQDRLAAKLAALAVLKPDDLAILFDDMRGDVPELAERQAAIVHFAAERERLALRSLLDVGLDRARHAQLLDELARREQQALAELEAARLHASGAKTPPERPASEAETRLAKLRPALAAGPKEFLNGRERVEGAEGLHTLMAFEVLNAVDAQRTGLDIARFVAAEAREAGRHYFGVVTPEAVLAYLENVAKAGMIRLE